MRRIIHNTGDFFTYPPFKLNAFAIQPALGTNLCYSESTLLLIKKVCVQLSEVKSYDVEEVIKSSPDLIYSKGMVRKVKIYHITLHENATPVCLYNP